MIANDNARPFVLRVATGLVELGRFEAADKLQASVGSIERGAIRRQVRSVVGSAVQRVVIDEFNCPYCERWIDVVRNPSEWDVDSCYRCS